MRIALLDRGRLYRPVRRHRRAAVPALLGGAARAGQPAQRPVPPPAAAVAGLPRHPYRRRDRLAGDERCGHDQRAALAGHDHPDRRYAGAGRDHRHHADDEPAPGAADLHRAAADGAGDASGSRAGPGWPSARRAPAWPRWSATWRRISPGCASSRLSGRRAPPRSASTRSTKPTAMANINAMSLSFIFLPAIEFLGMLATAIVLWFGGRTVGQGQVTLGVLVAFLSYVTRFFQPVQELSRLYTTLQSAMAGGEQVLKLLDTPPDVQDQPGAVEMPPVRGRGDAGACLLPLPPGAARGAARRLPDHPAGADGGAGGTDRRGQDLHRQPDRPLLRCERGRGADRRDRCAQGDAAARCTARSGWCRRIPSSSPARIADNIRFGRPEAADERGGSRPPGWRMPTISSPPSRTATRPSAGRRRQPVGGAAPADVHRPRHPDRPAHPDPG